MSDVRNCKKCGKMYQYMGGINMICRECIKREEDMFIRVREYLYDNPGSSITKIALELNVSTKKLTKYLKDGRLEIISGNLGNILLSCESCGVPIKTGRLCEKCDKLAEREIAASIGNAKKNISEYNKNSSKDDNNMRYLNKK